MLSQEILVLVITYNPDKTILEKINLPNLNYLIVDNSENHDFNYPAIYLSNPRIHYIQNSSNLGIAKALNIGAQYAFDNGYKWLLTMDQDSVLTENGFNQMLEFMECYIEINKLAILSPRHVMQGGLQVEVDNEVEEYSSGIKTMTSGNLLNVSIWQQLNGFDNALFIDMVDLDYYCKAIIAGYKVITLNHVYMEHQLGDYKVISIFGKKIGLLNHNYVRKYYQIRNSLTVYFRYRNQLPEVRGLLKHFVKIDLLQALPFEKDRFRKFRFLLLGVYHFLRHKLGKLNV